MMILEGYEAMEENFLSIKAHCHRLNLLISAYELAQSPLSKVYMDNGDHTLPLDI